MKSYASWYFINILFENESHFSTGDYKVKPKCDVFVAMFHVCLCKIAGSTSLSPSLLAHIWQCLEVTRIGLLWQSCKVSLKMLECWDRTFMLLETTAWSSYKLKIEWSGQVLILVHCMNLNSRNPSPVLSAQSIPYQSSMSDLFDSSKSTTIQPLFIIG